MFYLIQTHISKHPEIKQVGLSFCDDADATGRKMALWPHCAGENKHGIFLVAQQSDQ